MIEPQSGPFIFDTSAQSYLAATRLRAESQWMEEYSAIFPVHFSALTVVERMRGYMIAEQTAEPARHTVFQQFIRVYLLSLRSTKVLPFGLDEALVAAQLMAFLPDPPSSPRRAHLFAESRAGRLARWRFDVLIASTALVSRLSLIHNNPQDFEPLHAVVERLPERFRGVGPLDLISVKRLAA